LLDIRATTNFITLEEYKRYKIQIILKKRLYKLQTINRLAINSREVNKEIVLVYMQIAKHKERITLNVVIIIVNKVILSKVWFIKHNPSVNYARNTIVFN
jgi:hypothetical protein